MELYTRKSSRKNPLSQHVDFVVIVTISTLMCYLLDTTSAFWKHAFQSGASQ